MIPEMGPRGSTEYTRSKGSPESLRESKPGNFEAADDSRKMFWRALARFAAVMAAEVVVWGIVVISTELVQRKFHEATANWPSALTLVIRIVGWTSWILIHFAYLLIFTLAAVSTATSETMRFPGESFPRSSRVLTRLRVATAINNGVTFVLRTLHLDTRLAIPSEPMGPA